MFIQIVPFCGTSNKVVFYTFVFLVYGIMVSNDLSGDWFYNAFHIGNIHIDIDEMASHDALMRLRHMQVGVSRCPCKYLRLTMHHHLHESVK